MRARRGKRLATRVTVSVDQRDYEQLTALAEEYRVSLAWLVRWAVADLLERYRQDQLELPLEPASRRQRCLVGVSWMMDRGFGLCPARGSSFARKLTGG